MKIRNAFLTHITKTKKLLPETGNKEIHLHFNAIFENLEPDILSLFRIQIPLLTDKLCLSVCLSFFCLSFCLFVFLSSLPFWESESRHLEPSSSQRESPIPTDKLCGVNGQNRHIVICSAPKSALKVLDSFCLFYT